MHERGEISIATLQGPSTFIFERQEEEKFTFRSCFNFEGPLIYLSSSLFLGLKTITLKFPSVSKASPNLGNLSI